MHGVFMAPEQSRFKANREATERTPQAIMLAKGFCPLASATAFPKGGARLCHLGKKHQLEEYASE